MEPNQNLEEEINKAVITEDVVVENINEEIDQNAFSKEKNKFAASILFLFFTNFLLFISFAVLISSPLDPSSQESLIGTLMFLLCLAALPFNMIIFIQRSYVKTKEDIQNLTRIVIYWSVTVLFVFTFFIQKQLG